MHGFHDLRWQDQQLLAHINATVRLPARGHRNWTLHWVQEMRLFRSSKSEVLLADFHRRAGNLKELGRAIDTGFTYLRNLGHDGDLFP
jgi:hypothetical protein